MGLFVAEQTPIIRSFKNAPVIETVLSIQFAPISKLTIPYLGLYWDRVRAEFKRFELKPPIQHIVEDFGPGPRPAIPPIAFNLVTEPEIRCWFIEEKGNCFIQLQQDRFLYNWQRVQQNDVYPRYEKTRATFLKEWQGFCSFLESENLGSPEVDQCEVTYVNHIPYDAGWNTYGELNKVVSYWSGRSSGNFLPDPNKVNMSIRYLMPDDKGRLYITLQPVITRDAIEVLQLNLTARGAPTSSKTEDIFRWLDFGRQWVVEGFTDFTSKEMHKNWGREL
jgi:uncharacterized protein (TIGR04255 family)